MNKDFKLILKYIRKYKNIVIARHIGPDPDSIGAQIALRDILRKRFSDKNIYAVGNPASRFKFMGDLDKLDSKLDNALLIVLDTPDIKRIDGVDINDYDCVIKIDHHPFVEKYANIEYIDDSACSTCQILLEFFLDCKFIIDEEIGKLLYVGIVSDTDRFLHDYTSSKTFKLVAKLIDITGIDFTKLYRPLYSRPIDEVRFEGYIYQNLVLDENGLAYIKIDEDLIKEYKVDSASPGNMINDLKFVKDIIIWVFLSEDKKNNLIRANIRSNGPIINEVATRFGGGGHKYASGARLTSWEQADRLIEELDKLVIEYKNNITE